MSHCLGSMNFRRQSRSYNRCNNCNDRFLTMSSPNDAFSIFFAWTVLLGVVDSDVSCLWEIPSK